MYKRRIAIIVPGGVGAGQFDQGVPALVNLIRGLAGKFDITVFSMAAVKADVKPDNFEIKSIDVERWTLIRMIKTARLVLQSHKKKHFDLLHGIWGTPAGTLAVFLGKWLGRPSLVSLQGGEAASVQSIGYGHLRSGTKKRWLFRTLYAADDITALTHFQVNELEKHGFGNKEIQVIPYGVDVNLFKPAKKEYKEPIQFIHIGNLTEVKDQQTLLKAFKIIRSRTDCKLKIIGNDFYNEKIQGVCRQLELEDDVSFLGGIPHTDIPQQLAKSHVMLHTSLYEAQAVVIVEAMAAKVLVAGTRVGIIDDLEDCTVSVPVGDHEGLAKNVMEVLRQPERLNDKIEKAYEWVRGHDIKYTVKEFSTIYNRLLQ